MKWKEQGDVTDLAGFAVVWWASVSPYWHKEFRLADVSIDDIVLGVKAVDKEGNESPVAVYRIVPRLVP